MVNERVVELSPVQSPFDPAKRDRWMKTKLDPQRKGKNEGIDDMCLPCFFYMLLILGLAIFFSGCKQCLNYLRTTFTLVLNFDRCGMCCKFFAVEGLDRNSVLK